VRITTLTCGIYWLFTYDLFAAILGVGADMAIALNSAVAFFVFYVFNKKFRKNFFNLIKRRSNMPLSSEIIIKNINYEQVEIT